MPVLCLPLDQFLEAWDEERTGYAEWSRRSCDRMLARRGLNGLRSNSSKAGATHQA